MDKDRSVNIADTASYFAEAVFNDRMMRTRLSRQTYLALKATIEAGAPLKPDIADEVAAAMKQWAIERGATHFTHWFMPMTGATAEKHDGFLDALPDGQVIMNFSGKALIKGEPDASSFPSGGLRETAAARGYTAWDCTSPAFVKEGSLYIPTAFYSYTGEVLDKKAPLLRSNQVLQKAGLRLLRALGDKETRRVTTTIGPEQEYFLVDRELYERRPDLMFCGRTLFGAAPPKCQELSDSYYANLHPRVLAFMQELDVCLWKYGITAKTRHNEVAPTQHELAIIFDPSSVAADHNMLMMELMKKLAAKHGFACLLHEKPYRYFNGSGKHVNWSIAGDDVNLLDPGPEPQHNQRFLIFLAAMIYALAKYGKVLTLSVASASNEQRLGNQEAPPAILSMAIGEELGAILEAYREGRSYEPCLRRQTNLGLASISLSTVDTTDRNRTSPFAFTGNRFEFRMCGSSMNVAGPCYMLNTIAAKAFNDFAEILEGASNLDLAIDELIANTVQDYGYVVYGGDNYDPAWPEEARRRGLPVASNAVEAFAAMKDADFQELFTELGVLSREEIEARYEILLENYALTVNVECHTALDMARRSIRPAVLKALGAYAAELGSVEALGLEQREGRAVLNELSEAFSRLEEKRAQLFQAHREAEALEDAEEKARRYHEIAFGDLEELRSAVDQLERMMPAELWPMPTYRELLHQHY